ncbi:MAG: exodeoxyribonuclease VII large subunit, partial [Gemmatimonadales bacterium]
EQLERSGDRLHGALTALLDRRKHQVARLAAQLDALSPLRVLERGYAVPTDAGGRVLKRREEFVPGAPFTLRVADGRVDARVEPR